MKQVTDYYKDLYRIIFYQVIEEIALIAFVVVFIVIVLLTII